MYNLRGSGERKMGLGYHNRSPLLSTFRNPSGNPESQAARPTSKRMTRASSRAREDSTENGSSLDGEDEISSSKAPSVTTSPRGARIRRPTSVPEMSYDSMDEYADVDDFPPPAQAKTGFKALASLHEDGDIVPTTWKSSTKEHEEETNRLLKAKAATRLNPQHIRGAGFNAESVQKTPGSSWDKGPGRRKSKATYAGRKKSAVQPRPDSQAKIQPYLDTDDDSESKDELQVTAPKPGTTQANKEFIDPTKLYALPVKEDVQPQPRPFRDPMLVHPLPPRETGRQNGTDSMDTNSLGPQPKAFQNPMEKYKLPEKGSGPFVVIEKSKFKVFVDPFARKCDSSQETEEPESQLQTHYVDESNDEITSVKHGSDKGGSRKRKVSTIYPRTAIDLSTPKASYRDNEQLSSSPNDAEISIGGSQSSLESQFLSSSGRVRHMDDISLELGETKLREQEKKRKKSLEAADQCVLCNAVLPLGTLDEWKDDDGELRPIRMAEWTEICNKHKTADLRKEWEEKGYPVIEWKGLKKRVEKHHQFLVDVIKNKVPSPFREVFAKQQREIRGNVALLLRKDHQLQYPGYYGPRGSGILLHEITMRLASFVGDAGKKDGLIAQGGVAAFIQTVLVPELGVRLIMEDMNVREAKARIILDESREIGEKLNMDEFTEDIYDEEDGPWYDINAKTPQVVKKKKGLLDAWRGHDDDDDDDY